MKHLGQLHAHGNYIMESENPGDVPHYALKVFCWGDGNERRMPDEAAEVADEIAQAVNAYDALVAERDELKAQRGALVEACEMTGVYLGLWPAAAKSMQVRHYAELSEKITDTIALVEASQ